MNSSRWLSMALWGFLVQLAFASTISTVSNFNGDILTCPTTPSIEVAYGAKCAPVSKSGRLANIGATSEAQYTSSLQVAAGMYTLGCAYETSDAIYISIMCQYKAGTGLPLNLDPDQSSDCPDLSVSDSQPSPPPAGEDLGTFDKRHEQSAGFTCPQSGAGGSQRLVSATVTSGFEGPTATACTYVQVMDSTTYEGVCRYDSYGTYTTSTGTASLCPQEICASPQNMRRSFKRGVYIGHDIIRSRQASTAAIRKMGRIRRRF